LTANSNKSGNGGNSSTSTPSNITGGANGWLQARSGGVQTTNSTWTGGNTSWGSSWLLLKNLTAQVCLNTQIHFYIKKYVVFIYKYYT